MKLRTKIIIGLVVFSLFCTVPMFIAFEMQKDKFRADAYARVKDGATTVNELIDRNLFERYGDVQAFGQNRAAYNPANWGNPSTSNPLVSSINSYMTNYGIYQLSMLVSTNGKLLAVNTVDSKGNPLDTSALYAQDFSEADWFTGAMKGEFLQGTNGLTGTAVSGPHADKVVQDVYATKAHSICFSAQVKNESGELIGVWVNFAKLELVDDIITTFAKDFSGDAFKSTQITLIDSTGALISDYKIGQASEALDHDEIKSHNLYKDGVKAAVVAIDSKSSGSVTGTNSRTGVEQINGYNYSNGAYDYPGLGWTVLLRVAPEELLASSQSAEKAMIMVIAVIILLSTLLSFYLGGAFSGPIKKMTDTMRALAGGNMSVEVPSTENTDEIGDMAKAVLVFKDNMIQTEGLRAEQEKQKLRAAEEKKQAMNKMANDFELSVKSVVTEVSASADQMRGNAERLSTLAGETKSNSGIVASSATEAAQTATQVAAAAEELTAAIGEISAQVQKSSTVANQASSQAESINQSMHLLVEKSNRVGEVIQFITNIASQINLLALNATIESARAGEAGRGFAVVASEVKNLANQTAKATEEIVQQVQSMQEATQEAVQSVGSIITIISEISASTAGVAAAVEEQSAATNEISRNIAHTAAGTNEISRSIVAVEQGADETGTSSHEVLVSAKALSAHASVLSQKVDEFLVTVRTS
jgi:methyl-accepting chemotaxis protein